MILTLCCLSSIFSVRYICLVFGCGTLPVIWYWPCALSFRSSMCNIFVWSSVGEVCLSDSCWPCIFFPSSLCKIFLLFLVVELCLWHVLEMSVLSSVVLSQLSDVSGRWRVTQLAFRVLKFSIWRRGKSNPRDSGTTTFILLVVPLCKGEGINFYNDICKTPLPSILTITADIAPWLLFNTCLIKKFSR